MRRPARPAPPPQRPIAERLEQVRTRHGYPSLHSFWTRLVKDWPEDERPLSYEAARNYHYDRDPPIAYLSRVSDVFGVPLDYLVRGEGPFEERRMEDYVAEAFDAAPDSPEEEHAHRIYTALQEGAGAHWKDTLEGGKQLSLALPLHRGSTSLALLIDLWHRRRRSLLATRETLTPDDDIELARELGAAVMAPLTSLRIPRDQTYRYFLMEHIEAIAPVLRRAIEYEESTRQMEDTDDG